MPIGSSRRRRASVLVAPVLAIAFTLVSATTIATPAAAADVKLRDYRVALSDGQFVRGNAQLVLWSDGNVQFGGHLRNNGVFDYDMKVVCVVRLQNGTGVAYQFHDKIKGDLSTILSGNKSLDWWIAIQGFPDDAMAWRAATGAACRTSSTINIDQLQRDAVAALGIVKAVIVAFG